MAIRRVNLVLICPSGDCNRSLAATYYSARDWIASPRMHKYPQSYEPERVSGLPFTAKRLIPPFTAYGYSTKILLQFDLLRLEIFLKYEEIFLIYFIKCKDGLLRITDHHHIEVVFAAEGA